MKRLVLTIFSGLLLAAGATAAEFSPWDAWRNGHTYFEKGTQARDRSDYVYSLELFQRAEREYEGVRKARPDWNQKIIDGRLDDCRREIAAVKRLLGDSPSPTASGTQSDPTGGTMTVDSLELQTLRREANEYKQKLFEAMVELDELRRKAQQGKNAADEVANLLRDRRVAEEKYRLLEKRYRELEQQALEPDSRLSALEKQLVEEKLNTEMVTKRLQLAEARIQKLDQDAIEIYRQKSAAETLAKQRDNELLRNRSELDELRRFQQGTLTERADAQAKSDRNALLIKEYESRIVNLNTELDALRRRLEDTLKNGGDSVALNAELLAENGKLRETLTSVRGNVATTQEENAQLQAKQRDLQLELVQVRESAKRSDQLRARQEQENGLLQKEFEREKGSSELTALELKNLRERNRKLETDLQEWAERCGKLERRLEARNSEDIRNLTATDAARKQLAAEAEQLKLDSTALNSRVEELTRRNTELEAAARNSLIELQKLQATKLKLESDLSSEQSAREKLAGQMSEFDQLRQNFAALQKENATHREQLAELKNARTALETARKQLADFAGLQTRLAEVQKENQLLGESKRKLESELKARPVIVNADRPPDAGRNAESLPTVRPAQVGTPAELVAAGRKAEQDESLDLAVWNYKTALELAPDTPEAQARLGAIYLKREQFEQALPLLEAARLRAPGDTELAAAAAETLTGLKKYGNALAALETPLAAHPDHLRLLMAAARALTGSGQSKLARERLELAEKHHPEAPGPKLELARLLLKQSPPNEPEAARLYQAARSRGAGPDLELEPRLGKLLSEHREVNAFMASAAAEAEKNGDWNSAAWYYRQMLELDRENGESAARLAFAEFRLGRHPAALETLAMNRPSAAGALIGAMIHFKDDDFENAQKEAERAKSLAAGTPILGNQWPAAVSEFRDMLTGSAAQRSVAAQECARKLLAELPELRAKQH